ncbi:MAG: YkgJ family cysteine cluster protein, partial [Campylobacter curvus]
MRADGFCYEFDPGFCDECGGRCCTGESGYIWINESEITALCEYFGIDKKAFEQKFLIKVGAKFSLKEKIYDDGYACIFFDERDKNCSVYE